MTKTPAPLCKHALVSPTVMGQLWESEVATGVGCSSLSLSLLYLLVCSMREHDSHAFEARSLASSFRDEYLEPRTLQPSSGASFPKSGFIAMARVMKFANPASG